MEIKTKFDVGDVVKVNRFNIVTIGTIVGIIIMVTYTEPNDIKYLVYFGNDENIYKEDKILNKIN